MVDKERTTLSVDHYHLNWQLFKYGAQLFGRQIWSAGYGHALCRSVYLELHPVTEQQGVCRLARPLPQLTG